MKRFLVLITAIALVISLLAGCGGSSDPTTTAAGDDDATTTTAAADDSDKTENDGERSKVIIWDYFETDAQREMMADLISGFEAAQDKYTAEHIYVPFANFKNQLTVGLQSGDLPDLIIIDNPDMASYISMGLFVDVTDEIADIDSSEYFQGPWASTMLDGRNYGIPFATNCTALYYNKDMFAAAGLEEPPKDWDEFKEYAEKLTDPDNNVSGFGLSAVNTEEGTFQCLPWLYMAGGTFLDTEAAAVETFTLFQDMIESGALAKESINWTQSDVNNQFKSGTIAMQQNGPWQLPGIAADAPDLNFGVSIMPSNVTSSSALGGENLGVVKGNNQDGAVAFLKYYNNDEVMINAMKTYGSFPPKAEAAQNSFWTNDPLQSAFIDQLQTAVPRGPSPAWPSYSTAISRGFQEAMTSAKTPEDAARDMQAAIEAVD